MKNNLKILLAAGFPIAACASGPAFAQEAAAAVSGFSSEIPEPSNLALLAMGVIGLVIARYAAKNRSDDN